jgi:hypothetical protein
VEIALNKFSGIKKRNGGSYRFMRRVQEVTLPCRWIESCHEGKCPAFVRAGGNYTAQKKECRN